MNIREFVKKYKIGIESEFADCNPLMEYSYNMDNWKSTLKMGNKRMTIYFSKGVGHNGEEPKADEILYCLILDSSVIDLTFEDFCLECGYDTDSRKAEKTYRACKQSSTKLLKFLGQEKLEELKECIE